MNHACKQTLVWNRLLYYIILNPSINPFINPSLALLDLVGCGGHFNAQYGELRSPNWPNDYLNRQVCTWRISIPAAKAIHISFTHFEVQGFNMMGQCVDYVEIFSSDGKSLGKDASACSKLLSCLLYVQHCMYCLVQHWVIQYIGV